MKTRFIPGALLLVVASVSVDSITAGEEATFSLAQDLKNVGYSHPRAWHIAKKLLTKCGYLTGGQTPVHGPLTDEQRERLTRPRRAAS